MPDFGTNAAGNVYTFRPTSFTQLGNYTVVATACNTDTQCSSYTVIVVFANRAPAFGTPTSTTIKVNFGSIGTYTLPTVTDPDLDSFTISSQTTGGGALPSFVTYNSGSFSISPNTAGVAGNYSIDATACDGQPLCSTFTFTIQVVDEPVITTLSPMTVSVNLQSPGSLSIAAYDPAGLSLTYTPSGVPVFGSFSGTTFSFFPTSFSQLGTYTVTCNVCNTINTCTPYSFTLQFLNTAPRFDSTTSTSVSTPVTLSKTYSLPTYSDAEGDAISFSTYQTGQATLPSFVTFTSGTYTVSPTLDS